MPDLPKRFTGKPTTAVKRFKVTREDTRPTADERGYNARWRRWRKRVLAARPLCEDCAERGIVKEGEHLHHISGGGPLAPDGYDVDNIRLKCQSCHNRTTAREQRGKRGRGERG